jgi:hypothetical protein
MSTNSSEDLVPPWPELGELREELTPWRYRLHVNVAAAIPIGLAGLLGIAFWAQIAFGFAPQMAPMPLLWKLTLMLVQLPAEMIILGLSITAALAAVLVPIRIYRRRSLRVLVFDRGMAVLSGDQVETLTWDEVAAVRLRFNFSFRRTLIWGERRLIVERRDGRQLRFDDVALPRLRRLIRLVLEATLSPLLNNASERLERGETIPFGAVSVSPRGVTYKRRGTLRWDTIKGGRWVSYKRLAILREKKMFPWFISLSKVDNPHVLINLVDLRGRFREWQRARSER